LVVVIVARWGRAVRLHGKHGLWSAVRLSDDCHRSVAVWKEESLVARGQSLKRFLIMRGAITDSKEPARNKV
jgi:hypothetical protein